MSIGSKITFFTVGALIGLTIRLVAEGQLIEACFSAAAAAGLLLYAVKKISTNRKEA